MRDLVLLHGGLYNSSCWDRVVAELRQVHPTRFGGIVQLDLPGAGTKRHRRSEEISWGGIVDELCAEVHASRLERPVLIGHSIAGTLLPAMAQQVEFSEICFVTTAILVPGQIGNDLFGTGRFGDAPDQVGYPADPATTSLRDMDRIRFCQDFTADEAERWLDACYDDAPNMALMTTAASPIPSASLPPVTYVRALRSPVFPLEWQDRFASRISPDIRVVDIDTGHAPFFTHPRVLADLFAELFGD